MRANEVIAALALWADAGLRIVPGEWWRTWNWDAAVLLNLGLMWWLYGLGLSRLWGRAGVGRGVGRGQAAAFLGALAVIAVALLSPLDPLSDELASAHMAQHVLLMLVAAPLFVLASPGLVMTWALPRGWRPTAGRWRRGLAWHPLAVWVIFAALLWAWHLPAFYRAALRQPVVHDAQHLSFFAAGYLFWRALLEPVGRHRLPPLAGVLFLFTTSLHASVLGVLMALSPRPWYPDYQYRTPAWGLTPLEDQQLAGLIMWVPGCLIYAAVAMVLFVSWFAKMERAENERVT